MSGAIVSFDGLVASGSGASQELEVEAAQAGADDAFSSSMGGGRNAIGGVVIAVVAVVGGGGGGGHFERGIGGGVRREWMRRG